MNQNSSHKQSAVRAGYESLAGVLDDALNQAQTGKGHERHAQAQTFDQQPMQKLIDLYGSGFALGQAAKKMQEAQRLPYERARAELLGAINYAAGAVIALDRMHMDGRLCDEGNKTASFPIVPRPEYAPAWANGEGVSCTVGPRRAVWINGNKYAYKEAADFFYRVDKQGCLRASEITRTSFFADAVAHVGANDNATDAKQHG